MAIDLRAKVYCSLGRVISGNLNDSYLQETGLVKTTGQVILSGIYAPSVGQIVQFGYYQNNYLSRIPRCLRVLSFFADPFRNETTVELGDALVYYENRKPALKNPSAAEENEDVPCSEFQLAPPQISASYVFTQCLTALGLTSSGASLTNKFTLDEFDISAGYISVISDLLVSENQFGYLNENEVLIVKSFNTSGGIGPSIKEWDIIDVSSIGSGDLPGDAVAVNYSSLKLKVPGDEETANDVDSRNWEYEKQETINSDIEMTLVPRDGVPDIGQAVTYSYPNHETRETRNTYDSWNRKTKSVTTITKTIAASNSALLESIINYDRQNIADDYQIKTLASSVKSLRTIEREERYWTYDKVAFGGTNNCVYKEAAAQDDIGRVIKEEYYLYQDSLAFVGSMSVPSYVYKKGTELKVLIPSYRSDILAKKQVIEYEAATVNVGPVESETTKTTTTDWISVILTPQGQLAYARLNAKNIRVNAVQSSTNTGTSSEFEVSEAELQEDIDRQVQYGSRLVVENINTENYYGYKVGLQIRPGSADRFKESFSSDDPTESKAEIEWVTGSSDSQNVVEFSLPYAPDDRITGTSLTGYNSIPSDAPAKARAYGATQNKLLLGNRFGVSLQISSSLLPPRPFDPIYINAKGIMGEYRVNGAGWTFDSTGIVSSVDALFWGAVGAS